jgi:outer membrane protein assembly factor BamD (BamD/ComL family)
LKDTNMPDTSRAARLRRALTLFCLLLAAVSLLSSSTAARAQGQERDSFSKNKEADALMHEGESFFAAKQWDKAQEAYEKAFKLSS